MAIGFLQLRTPCIRSKTTRSVRMPTPMPIRIKQVPTTSRTACCQVPCCRYGAPARGSAFAWRAIRPLPNSKTATVKTSIYLPGRQVYRTRSRGKFSRANGGSGYKKRVNAIDGFIGTISDMFEVACGTVECAATAAQNHMSWATT